VLKYKIQGHNTKIINKWYSNKSLFKIFCSGLTIQKSPKHIKWEFFTYVISIIIIVNAFNLSSICVNLDRFLIRVNFDYERYAL